MSADWCKLSPDEASNYTPGLLGKVRSSHSVERKMLR